MVKKAIFTVIILIALLAGAREYFFAGGGVTLAPFLPPSEDLGEILTEEKSPFTLPFGFRAEIFARIPGARVIVHAGEEMGGGLLVSATGEGKIYLARNTDADPEADETTVLLEGLQSPHGIAVRCLSDCMYYVAEEDNISTYTYNPTTKKLVKKERLVELPRDGGHFTRTLMFMPHPRENTLLISVGSSCNVCHEEDPRRAKFLAYDINTKKVSDFGRGLRNSVFMTIHPVMREIWATEMGRDLLGDDIPPDEINIVRQENGAAKNYGWPNCYGENIHDTDFDRNTYIRNPCMEPFEMPSHIDIPAHSAPLGLAFVAEEGWPHEWWHDLLVAYHGSWNRSAPAGYKIVRFPLDARGNPESNPEGEAKSADFMTGFIPENAIGREAAIGRPVDILVEPGGVMYVSDDKAGAIYRISRK